MNRYKTSNCIMCGEKAVGWHGHVVAKERMALGNLIDVKVIAGFCKEHNEGGLQSDINGCYGQYSRSKHGELEVFKI
ncbi:hypothetical protein CS063_17370 [Sporanaerobium hydrogeniformans]|uniref:Uncharacterized protein n=1 Tax=Sporanaerobium hydrogeniformans TaxID=3072179 RepID=A0AC61D613_9FIRM|nr:hypothetical protein [Sporanaerobium hydrogeniformans]PHV69169.1 hypothetical protein CS063_17370 [Sporanaerobium hydrogeniformans]